MTAAITQLATALSALSTDEARAALEAAVPVPVRGAARTRRSRPRGRLPGCRLSWICIRCGTR